MELFKEFHDNLSFKKWLSDKGFGIKHMPSAGYKKGIQYTQTEPKLSMVADKPDKTGNNKEK